MERWTHYENTVPEFMQGLIYLANRNAEVESLYCVRGRLILSASLNFD